MHRRLTLALVVAIAAAACGGSTAVTEISGPDAVRCQTSFSTPPSPLPADGTRVSLTVLAARECTWNASSDASWAQVSPTSGQGETSVTLTVAANPEARARTGAVVVNDSRLSLTQEAAPCRYEVTPTTVRLSHEAGRAAVQVTATPGCSWQASSNQAWAQVSPASGTSSATVEIQVSGNTDAATRGASVTVADRTVTVEQEAFTPAPNPNPPSPNPPNPNPNCSLSLDSSERSFPASGGDGTIRVTAGGGCRWSAVADRAWIELSGSTGTGSDTVRYRVAENTTTDRRTGTITISGQTFTVRQDAAAAPPAGGGGGGGGGGGQNQQIDLTGRAFLVGGSCPTITFFLNFRAVYTTGDTKFKGRCTDIQGGTELRVEGVLTEGRVRATKVDIQD